MKQKVYIETSVISYLTAKLSRDLIVIGHQQITTEWWKSSKNKFNCFISEFVIDEIIKGDLNAAKNRIEVTQDIPILEYSSEIGELAFNYAKLFSIPQKARIDSFHLAIAVWFEIDYLLSWNCKHIANGVVSSKLKDYNNNHSLFVPILCTPLELLEV